MARRQSRFLVQQKNALGVLGVLVVAAMGYLSYLAFRDQPLGEFVEGEHYQVVENPRRVRGDAVEVMEFFSYGCVHCYNLDPDLTDWVEDRGESVRFVRMPVMSTDYWRLLGRAYYTMQALDLPERYHTIFFRAIHEGRQTFNTVDRIRAFFEDAGVSADDFAAAFNSGEVSDQVRQADQMARRLKVAAVPTIVVQGKYVVRTTRDIGLSRMLDVISHLIDNQEPKR